MSRIDDTRTERNTRLDETNGWLKPVETRVDAVGRDIAELRDGSGNLEGTVSARFRRSRRRCFLQVLRRRARSSTQFRPTAASSVRSTETLKWRLLGTSAAWMCPWTLKLR